MPGPALDTPQQLEVLQDLARGEQANHIAERVGVHESTISRLKSKDESKRIIEAEQQKLLAALPDIVQSTKEELQTLALLSRHYAGLPAEGAEGVIERLSESVTEIEGEAATGGKFSQTTTIKKDAAAVMKYYQGGMRRMEKIMQSVGIFPSSSMPSVVFNQVYNDHRRQVAVNPTIIGAIGRHLDAEFETIDDHKANEAEPGA